MEAHCIDVERIGEVAELPDHHPDRRHAETCPRCRSLVESYRAFMKAESAEGSGVEKARAVLDARIRKEAERWVPSATRASSMTGSPVREPWWRGFLKPAPMLAGAAVIAIAAVFVWTSRAPEEGVLRDDGAQAQLFALQETQVDDQSIHLSWTAMAGADAYQVRLYGPDLNEVYRHPDLAGTSVVIARSALSENLADDLTPSLDLTWRVYALSGGDVIEVSEPGSIRAP